MTFIKKIIPITLALFGLILLVACSNTSKAYFQSFNSAGKDRRITLHYQKDRVVKQTTYNEVTYEFMGVENVEEAKEFIANTYDTSIYQGLKGVTQKLEYKDDRLVENLEIDYSRAKITDIYQIINLTKEEAQELDYISLKKGKKTLENAGIMEVKDGKFQELSK